MKWFSKSLDNLLEVVVVKLFSVESFVFSGASEITSKLAEESMNIINMYLYVPTKNVKRKETAHNSVCVLFQKQQHH